MTLPPFLTQSSARMLIWFWAGIVGLGATGATALQVMGPPALPSAPAPAAAEAEPTAIELPAIGAPLWPATTTPPPADPAASASTARPEPAPHRPAPPRQVRITVVPPMPPEPHRAHAPGPRAFAKLELRAPHHNPTHERVVTYSYAEAEPPATYSRGVPYGYAPSYAPPGYGWQYPGPRSEPRGSYYAYYPSY